MVVDDHPVVCEGIAALLDLQDDMEVVARARNGRDAVTLFRETRPDITLMDLNMPVMAGVEAILAIRDEDPAARIIILTTYDGDEDIYRGLRAGARAYLLKDAPVDTLLDTIRQVNLGKILVPPEVAAKLTIRLTSPELTPRETDVLRLMADGCSNTQIGSALFITESTVKAHVNRILHKLNVCDRTEAVTTALKRGLIHFSSA